jgi:hypothetical protein
VQWPKKEECQQLIDMYKNNKISFVKVLKKGEKYLLVIPSQDDVLTIESHPRPSIQYTKVIPKEIDPKGGDYKHVDLVSERDVRIGQPNTHKDSKKFWLGPFKVRGNFVNDSHCLSTMQGRRHPLPVSGHLLKPHCGKRLELFTF